MDETLRVLEFPRIRELLAGYAATGPGRAAAAALLPDLSRELAASALAESAESMRLVAAQGALPVAGSQELGEILRAVQAPGSLPTPAALLAVRASLAAAKACRRALPESASYPRLSALVDGLNPLRELAEELGACLDERGELRDDASFELGELRRRVRRTRDRIRAELERLLADERYAGVFQERLITERNGRSVVPVRADQRGRVKGFVHDESGSGQTLFIEPAAVLEENNQLQALLREEQREQERILRRLGALVRDQRATLERNQELLARLDLLNAIARYADLCGAVAPRLVDEPLVELLAARHPLLILGGDGQPRAERAVAVDLRLPVDCRALVISGPNTGGKTAALKTFGLLVLMVRTGLPVPCHADSRLHLFERIFADIGDAQSLDAGLSTFSGHVARLVSILAEADADSLVLLDEVGTGTDPVEGGALALATLDALHRRGARTVVSTHLHRVKGYAQLSEGVENAAVEFDPVTLAPTYRLHYGVPGASSAFTIAHRLGLPAALIERARGYLGEQEGAGRDLVEELNRLRVELAAEREATRREREEARREREHRRRLLREIESEREKILGRAAQRGEQAVRRTEQELQALLRQARAQKSGAAAGAQLVGQVREAGSRIAELRPQAPSPRVVPRQVTAGEILHVPALGTDATVIRLQGETAELECAGKRLRLPLAELRQHRPRRFAGGQGRTQVQASIHREGFQPRLLLVGERVEEALGRLERFLDDALLHGLQEVEVVHGAGTGRLRRALRQRLAEHRGVAASHPGAPEQGGDNVTVVILKS